MDPRQVIRLTVVFYCQFPVAINVKTERRFWPSVNNFNTQKIFPTFLERRNSLLKRFCFAIEIHKDHIHPNSRANLAKALDCSVNDLPLSLALSHLEQKAAAVLLTLLNLGVKNIRLGPSLPAYVTPGVLQVLIDNYNIMPTGDVQEDIANIMEGK